MLLFLTGGVPQHDTFDPKPLAPDNVRGELSPLATSVPGVQVSELFPLFAQRLHRVTLLRSVTHDDTVHTSAGYTMLTGRRHPRANNRLAPPTDAAMSALLDDLADRGMLDDTLVVVMGEFGRSPKINRQAGRDHWPGVATVVLAGAGIQPGAVCGASDRFGGLPHSDPVTPADLTATILHLLGVPPELELHDQTGRPHIACDGSPVLGLFGSL